MTDVLSELIGLLIGALSDMATGIGSGVNSFITELFLKTNASTHAVEGLSVFGGIIGVFGGVALAIGLGRLIYRLVATLGGSR